VEILAAVGVTRPLAAVVSPCRRTRTLLRSFRAVVSETIHPCKTGYNICPSSDFTFIRTFTKSQTATPLTCGLEETLSDLALEKFVTVSEGSEYVMAALQSSRHSFFLFPELLMLTEYASMESMLTYRTASEPTEYLSASQATSYHTASEPGFTANLFESEIGDIPSETSTSRSFLPTLPSEAHEERSVGPHGGEIQENDDDYHARPKQPDRRKGKGTLFYLRGSYYHEM